MRVDNDFNKWNINKLPRTRGAQGVGGSNGIVTLTAGNREGKGYPELEAHYLWGQFFNGRQDVNGDITTDGNVNFYGNLNFLGEYDSDDDLRGNLNIGNVNADNGHFKEMNTDLLKAAEAYINNLTVTGSAHFFELIIDKIRSVGGAIMLTPGDGFELWGYNLSDEKNINLWWVCDDVKGAKYNHWKVGDQALCKSFDESVIGESTYTSNKNWWAKVVAVNESSTWCVKLGADEYNPDLVTSIHDTDYNNTHSYLRKTDFMPSDKYVYVEKTNRANWISNEEYFNLSDSDKTKYEYSQLYIHQNDDGSVIQITKLQYNNADPSNTDISDILVYDDKEKGWRLLRDFCKADCKSCFSITIDIDKKNCSPGSKFSVSGSNYTAYVFQEGDNVIMIGHQKQQNETEEEAANRQNAIYLNAGGQGDSLDTDLRPPFFAQYKGINDFNLTKHRLTWFSGGWVGAQGTQGYANNIQGNLKIATGESVEEYVGSEIIAQSDAITMRVKSDISEAGITIHDDEIILDADKTTVTGTLQLNDDKTGLVLYDDNGLPVISILNTPTGDITDTRTPLNTRDTIELTTQANMATFHMKRPYSVRSGKTYNLNNLIASCMVGGSGANISSVTITITLRRKDNNNIVIIPQTLSKTISGTGQGYVTVGDFAFAANYTGQVYIDVSMTVYFNQTYSVGNVLYGNLNGEIIQPTNKIVKLGNDGLQVVNASDKYCILGDSNYTLRQGNSTLSITNDYMRRSIGSSTGDIGSIVKVKICTQGSNNSIYSPDDGLVIFNGSWSGDPIYYLPNPASTSVSDGRVIYFKNLSGRTLKFRTQNTDNVLIGNDSDTPNTEITVERRSCMMICGGGYWIFYLG